MGGRKKLGAREVRRLKYFNVYVRIRMTDTTSYAILKLIHLCIHQDVFSSGNSSGKHCFCLFPMENISINNFFHDQPWWSTLFWYFHSQNNHQVQSGRNKSELTVRFEKTGAQQQPARTGLLLLWEEGGACWGMFAARGNITLT